MIEIQAMNHVMNLSDEGRKQFIKDYANKTKEKLGEEIYIEDYINSLTNIATLFYTMGDANCEMAINLLEKMKVATKGKVMDCNKLIDIIIGSFKEK
jgi:hypothetical protein